MAKFINNYHPKLIQNLMDSNLSGALSANLFIPLIVTYLFHNYFSDLWMYSWLGLHVAIFIARVSLVRYLKTTTKIHFLLLSLSSLSMAALAWQSLFYADEIHMLLLGMIIASIVAGSVTTLVSVFHIFVSFVTIQLLGLISAFIYMQDDIFYLSAFLATAFLYLVLTNGYKQFKSLEETLKLNKQIHNLLDNAGQGFLSFDKNLKCSNSFSHECKRIFKLDNIQGLDISELLFSNSIEDKELFYEGIKRAIETQEISTKELFLSLIPKKQIINNIPIKIECKIIQDEKFMLILTDITKTKNLKETLEYQNKVQTMIVAVAANKNDFMEIKDSFEEFQKNIKTLSDISDENIKSILRDLHTFKGTLTQKGMINIPQSIYNLELEINKVTSNNKILTLIKKANLQEEFNKDIKIINNILGEWFLHSQKLINVNTDAIDDIELNMAVMYDTLDKDKQTLLDEIIMKVQHLKYRSLKRMLSPYISHVKQMGLNLEKELHTLEINGDNDVKISPKFKEFINSLVHLFNNCIDHGIEDIDLRAKSNKDEFGTIGCSYQVIAETLIIQISDDGQGIDTDKLTAMALKNSIITQDELINMSDDKKYELVFEDNLSTKDNISNISGIGIGMSAIKENLKKLDGKCKIESKKGSGVTFTFFLPLNLNKDKYLLSINQCTNISNAIIRQVKTYTQENMDLMMINDTEIDEVIIGNNYAQIDLYDGFNGSIIILFSNKIKKLLADKLIPKDFNEEDANWMMQELPDESLNTIIGLSLSDIEKDFGLVRMSPPIHNDNFYLMDLIHKSQNKFARELETSLGTITLIVIQKEK